MAPKYRQFRLHRAHEVSCEGITGKTVLGSVAMIATTQQKLPSLRIAGPHAEGCRSQGAGECGIRVSLIALE
jgi:hypothetical protein